jgi:hypothetical protein
MGNIEILSVKVKKTVEKLRELTNENHKLKVELVYLKNENARSRKQVGEYLFLKRHVEEAVIKIERIIKKIDTVRVL